MDPSSSPEHDDFRVVDLFLSEHTEDREIAEKAVHTLETIVRDLKPILRYITQPRPSLRGPIRESKNDEEAECTERFAEGVRPKEKKVIEILRQSKEEGAKSLVLFLNDQGVFLVAHLCPREPVGSSTHEHMLPMESENRPGWQYFRFGDVLKNLHDRLAEARAKREAHVRAIEKREERLSRVLEIYSKRRHEEKKD